jgi:hypothetical protein
MKRFGPAWVRPVICLAGLLIAYYAFPLRIDTTWETVVSVALTVVGLGLLGWTLASELIHTRRGREMRSTRVLIFLLILLVIMFSLTFFLVNRVDPDQITGLETKTDALYFTLSTMATVGYGDVHAEGQFARGLASALIVFNVVVVASLAREHFGRGVGGPA